MTQDERQIAAMDWHYAKASCDVDMLIATWWPAFRGAWSMIGIHAAIESVGIDRIQAYLRESE